jgi:hypothetical protein
MRGRMLTLRKLFRDAETVITSDPPTVSLATI